MKLFYAPESDEAKATLRAEILRWLGFLAGRLERGYLFGDAFTVADAYLFAMARGAVALGFALPQPLPDYIQRINARPAVQEALRREGAA